MLQWWVLLRAKSQQHPHFFHVVRIDFYLPVLRLLGSQTKNRFYRYLSGTLLFRFACSMTDHKNKKSLAEKLELLRQKYQSKLPAEMAALQVLAESLKHKEQVNKTLDDLHHRLHKLSGSSSTFGLARLGEDAHKLEQRINTWIKDGPSSITEQAIEQFTLDIIALSETLSQKSELVKPTAFKNTSTDTASFRQKIWLVEDDKDLGQELALQLESFGFVVTHFNLALDVETALQQDKPDLLLLDVILDKENVNTTELITLLPGLRSLDCPVVFMSAHDDFHSRLRAAQQGAEGYFIKPINIPSLVNHLEQIFVQQNAEPERVLIIDDDLELASYYQLTLLEAGMEVKILNEPEIIIESISAFRPELILMDLHLPGYSGHDLAGVIRQHEKWASLPIVYLSAETDPALQIEAMGRGADDFQTKPISNKQLIASVRVRIERARQLDTQINRDSLTGLLKHSSIKEEAELALMRAKRSKTPVTLVMLDIDLFKKVNDSYGHAMGDVVISSIAMLLKRQLRQSDIIGRYGGEEFVAVLPDCDLEAAATIMNKIRERFADIHFNHEGKAFSCTFSAGIACSEATPTQSATELLDLADQALFVSKRNGRNQVQKAV